MDEQIAWMEKTGYPRRYYDRERRELAEIMREQAEEAEREESDE